MTAFADDFRALTGHAPLRWQARLFDALMGGSMPDRLDLPTGLGKTSVMAVWLIARARGAPVPRRLVYVVDRRAVVDQATAEAERFRNSLAADAAHLNDRLGLAGRPLPISTLRGQYADNRAWLADPATPAIVVGTVDMVGSRLLFSGYGVSRRMRPYHAGLLGLDTLIVLDEAHLVPPFERLLEAVAAGQRDSGRTTLGARGPGREIVGPKALRTMALSATGRQDAAASIFRLCPEDREDGFVAARLGAAKVLTIEAADAKTLDARLADEAWALADADAAPARIVIYCHGRDVAQKVHADLAKRLEKRRKANKSKAPYDDVELLTGARRVFEREETARWLAARGFTGRDEDRGLDRPAFLVATSAGEVGVDMDADHMVCDLVEWERMVQRLGRVNRAGRAKTARVVALDASRSHEDKAPEAAARRAATRTLLEALPARDGGRDASPQALVALRDGQTPEAIAAASTPPPLRPAVTRALVDAWAMTSLDHHTGRPDVTPWLRGWETDPKAQTRIVWRTWLPAPAGESPAAGDIEAFFEAAPPHLLEVLETDTPDVSGWLIARLKAVSAIADKAPFGEKDESTDAPHRRLDRTTPVAFILDSDRKPRLTREGRPAIIRLGDVPEKKRLEPLLAGATLVVDARLGGLDGGLLADKMDDTPRTADADTAETAFDDPNTPPADAPRVGFRIRHRRLNTATAESAEDTPRDAWASAFRFAVTRTSEGEPLDVLEIESAVSEDARALYRRRQPETLADHQRRTGEKAAALARAVLDDGDLQRTLETAARLHDEGKRAHRWQRAFRAPKDGEAYAKTRGPISHAVLGGYRHELGSLDRMEAAEAFHDLPAPMQDLALHLVAAHHGYARPVIGIAGGEHSPEAMQARAAEVALRYARLQEAWGPWGLAWLEALLRAADQQASREGEESAAAPETEAA